MDFVALLEDEIDIAAPPARVWELVSDVRRMSEWSPQVTSTRLRAGHDGIGPGAQFTNRNHHGELVWTTHGEIVRFEPEHELAFRIAENRLVWSFRLDPDEAGGTRLTERREAPEGISQLSLDYTDRHLGGQAAFTEIQRAGMRATLVAIKAAAERHTPHPG